MGSEENGTANGEATNEQAAGDPEVMEAMDEFEAERQATETDDARADAVEKAKLEAELAAREAERKLAQARAAEALRHHPRLFRDKDGDEANEFWEEAGKSLRKVEAGLKEVTRRL